MAKTEQFTPEQVIKALQDTKGLISLAAQTLECSAQTIRNYAKRYASVRDVLHEERESMTDVAELSLYNAITGGEPWAVTFYLKTQGKARGYVERRELDIRHIVERTAAEMGLPVSDVMAEFQQIVRERG